MRKTNLGWGWQPYYDKMIAVLESTNDFLSVPEIHSLMGMKPNKGVSSQWLTAQLRSLGDELEILETEKNNKYRLKRG